MKNIFKYLLCFMMLLCLCTSVYAQGDVSGIVSGNQDHLMLATVVDITDTSIILAPHQLIYIDNQDEQSTFLTKISVLINSGIHIAPTIPIFQLRQE